MTSFLSPAAFARAHPGNKEGIRQLKVSPAFELHQQWNRFPRGHAARWTLAAEPGRAVQCDCAYLRRYKSGLWPFLLVCVDVFSTAYAVQPMHSLQADATVKAIVKILDTNPLFKRCRIHAITTDQGGEFKGAFASELRRRKIRQYYTNVQSKSKCAYAEKAIGDIKVGPVRYSLVDFNLHY